MVTETKIGAGSPSKQNKKIKDCDFSNDPWAKKLDEGAIKVIHARYLMRTPSNETVETPNGMIKRIGQALAEVEQKYGKTSEEITKFSKEFYDVMFNLEFITAGRSLCNIGNKYSAAVVSNCVVLHIDDSLDDIFYTLTDAALLQQAGSGVGFPFHKLRPAGTLTKRTFGVSSGAVSFIHVYNTCFGVVKQRGRHGANMGVLRCDHPDILEFIKCKDKEGDIKNFNISVGITEKFMQEVQKCEQLKKEGKPQPIWKCYFKGKEFKPRIIHRDDNYNLIEIEEVDYSALDIWNVLIKQSYKNGEPGVVFLDTVNKSNPLPGLGPIECCNPCGEQFLHSGDACNLGAINLDKFVENKKVKWDRLEKVTRTAVRMLDNVIDLTSFPIKRVDSMFKGNRRIGLGIMGLADMLFQLEIGYNTDLGRNTSAKVVKFINDIAHNESTILGKEKGNFPNHSKSIYAKSNTPHRNAALTNIAPTGSTSMICNSSGGVEPYFALAFYRANILSDGSPNKRKQKEELKFSYINKYLKDALIENGIYSEEIMDRIVMEGSLQNIDKVPEKMKKVFVTSMDIKPKDHILMQSTCQEFVDNAISKTINLPNEATMKDISDAFKFAWSHGCKGCTVYRDGSRKIQVLNLNKKKKDDELAVNSDYEDEDENKEEDEEEDEDDKKFAKDASNEEDIEIQLPFKTACRGGKCDL